VFQWLVFQSLEKSKLCGERLEVARRKSELADENLRI
jgi:hypothetical protein